MTVILRWLGYIQPSHLPLPELLKFVLFANFSIVGMNVSLMWNSVGFYQVNPTLGLFLLSGYHNYSNLNVHIVLLLLSDCQVEYDTRLLLIGSGLGQDSILPRHEVEHCSSSLGCWSMHCN